MRRFGVDEPVYGDEEPPVDGPAAEPEPCGVCQEDAAVARCERIDEDCGRCRTLLCASANCRARHGRLCHPADLPEEVWS